MKTIELTLQDGQWVATDNDFETFELFGTNTLPTPYLETAPAARVVEAIRKLNPTAKVTLGKAETRALVRDRLRNASDNAQDYAIAGTLLLVPELVASKVARISGRELNEIRNFINQEI